MGVTLAICPREEPLTETVGEWLASAENDCRASIQKHTIESSYDKEHLATQAGLRAHLQNAQGENAVSPDIIAYYGHGTRCRLCVRGIDSPNLEELKKELSKTGFCEFPACTACLLLPVGESLLDLGCLHLLRGRVIYVVACHSRQRFGRMLVEANHDEPSTAFFGYDKLLTIPVFPESEAVLRDAVNSGLVMLHRRNETSSPGERFRTVRDLVRKGLWDAWKWAMLNNHKDEIVLEGWRLGFDGEWVGKE